MLRLMKAQFHWILFCFTLMALAGCGICTCKKIICPEYNDSLFDQWAPYAKDQVLIFKNLPGVADTIKISGIQKSEAYEGTTGGGYGCGKGCYASLNIYGTDAQGIQFNKFNFSNSKSSTEAGKSNLYFRLNGGGFSGFGVSDTGFIVTSQYGIDYRLRSNYLGTVTFGNKTFNNTQMIIADTFINKQRAPYKFYFSKNNGLVAWETYPDKIVWVKE